MKKLVFLALILSQFSIASSTVLSKSTKVDVDKSRADGKNINNCRKEVDSRGEQVSSTGRTLRQMDLGYLLATLQEPHYSDPRFGSDNCQTKKENETDEDYLNRVVRELEARMIFIHRNTKPLSPATLQWMETIHAEPLDVSDVELEYSGLCWDYNKE